MERFELNLNKEIKVQSALAQAEERVCLCPDEPDPLYQQNYGIDFR